MRRGAGNDFVMRLLICNTLGKSGRLVPVLAIGFPDLKTRLAAQEGEATRQSSHLKTINERISALEQKHSLSDSVRTSAAMKRQAALHHRIVSIARKSHVLIPSLRGTNVTKEEEALRSKLEACEAELESAGGSEGGGLSGGAGATSGRLRARVNELWSMLGAVKTRREMLEQEGRKPSVEWAVVDERGVQEVANVSSDRRRAREGRACYRIYLTLPAALYTYPSQRSWLSSSKASITSLPRWRRTAERLIRSCRVSRAYSSSGRSRAELDSEERQWRRDRGEGRAVLTTSPTIGRRVLLNTSFTNRELHHGRGRSTL